jgi:hypothetical protein
MTMSENIKSARELVIKYYENDIPCWLIGPPGVGKSELAEQITKELRIGLIDQRVSQLDPVDLRGLPHVTTVDKEAITAWARPDFLPRAERDGERGILLLDELGDSSRAMQSACYQLILNRCIGDHKIPPGWYPMAASNDRTHKAAAQAVSTALANRFAWINVDADQKVWDEYANEKGVHHYIRGFLKSFPHKIHTMEGCTEYAYGSPRSWMAASKIIDTPPQIRFRLLRGLVGEGNAGEFEGWLRTVDLPDFDDVIKNPTKCKIPVEPSSRYALSCMLARRADKKNFEKIMAYCKREEYGRDFEISTVLDATKRDPSLTETKTYFVDFASRNSDVTL